MGIPFYFVSLLKSHAGIVDTVKKNCPLEVDVLGIDFNCLIHRYLKEEDPIGSILTAFEYIMTHICKAKKVLVAMDGLVPYAKIVQQRYRRMRAKDTAEVFDRNQISPGTPYMKDLESGIRAKFPSVEISSTLLPGEGEHKLFLSLKKIPEEERKTVCIYGLDADLILICLKHSHMATKMSLLRESSEFNDPKVASAEFASLNIKSLLNQVPLQIDQYIALSILCFGNDFMPHLAIFSLREGGYERALQFYNESGSPNLLTFEGRSDFLEYCASKEMIVLKDMIGRRRRPEERAILGKEQSNFSRKYGLHILDGVTDMEPVVDAYWKTFHWTLSYFNNGLPTNWSWYYPYPEAPLITDIMKYDEADEIEKSELNYSITNQLQFILPSKSLRLAKKIRIFNDEIYTETRAPWLKRHEWEADPHISLPWNPSAHLTSVSRF
jgi:5'-3' exonuclease